MLWSQHLHGELDAAPNLWKCHQSILRWFGPHEGLTLLRHDRKMLPHLNNALLYVVGRERVNAETP